MQQYFATVSRSALGAVLICATAFTQEAISRPEKPLPEEVVFDIIFRQIRSMKNTVNERERKGISAGSLRDHYKDAIGLTDAENVALTQVALTCGPETEDLNQRASGIIAAAKAHYRSKPSQTEQVPPVPPELISLQSQKEAVIRKCIASLEGQLGRGTVALMTADLRRYVASHISRQMPR